MRLDQLVQAVAALDVRVGSGNDYELACQLGQGFVGRSAQGATVVLLPIVPTDPGAGRRTGSMRVTPSPSVRISYAGREWTETAAVIECLDASLTEPFLALASDLALRLAEATPTWEAVIDIFEEWQRLLARRGKLSVEKEVGLWGELRFILDSPNPDTLLGCWRGPSAATIDFQGAIGVEVKTSLAEHEHDISHDQVSTLISSAGYLVSMWIESDPAGVALPELIRVLKGIVAQPDRLLREILRVGYSPADETAYTTCYRLREAPAWYRGESVPRPRELDVGVMDVRYTVRLSPEARINDDECSKIWAVWCPERSS